MLASTNRLCEPLLMAVTLLIFTLLSIHVQSICTVGGPPSVEVAFPGPSYNRIYHLIDYFLLDHPRQNTVEENLDRAIDFLESKAAKENWLLARSYKGAANQLKALESLKSGPRCDERDLEIIIHNDQASRYRAHRVKVDSMRPMVRVVHHYLRAHAEYCLPLYKSKFSTLSRRLNKLKYQRVRDFSLGYMNGRVMFMTEQAKDARWTLTDFDNLRSGIKLLFDFNSTQLIQVSRAPAAEMIFDALKVMTEDNVEAKYLNQMRDKEDKVLIPRNKYRMLFKRYLREPCSYYIKKVADDLMKPALYEASILEEPTKENILESIEYYSGQVGYQLCRFIIEGSIEKQFEQFIWQNLEENEVVEIKDPNGKQDDTNQLEQGSKSL